MIYHKNWIILAAVVFMLIGFIPSAQAEPPLKEGNPGLPGCLAKVEELEQIIAELLNAMENYAPGPQTGQTVSYATGDDGDLKKGVVWPNPRFIDHEDGTVTDNLTGLMWTKNAQQFQNGMLWPDGLTACNDLFFAGYDDWRLPNLRELQSLIDYGHHAPALPADHPFTDVQFYFYWSSTTNVDVAYPNNAWGVRFNDGFVIYAGHEYHFFVWCMRGGQ